MKTKRLECSRPDCLPAFRLLYIIFALLFFIQVNPAANLDPAFNASVTEGTGFVEGTIVQPDGSFLAFGYFQRVDNQRRGGIVRFKPEGVIDGNFNASGTGANNTIYAARILPDGKILIGGSFTAYNGQARNRLARLNTDGSLDTTFNSTANFNNSIADIIVQNDGKIIVCGWFSAPNGQPLASKIVRLNADGSIDNTFFHNVATNGEIVTMALLPDGKILIGGYFINFGNLPSPTILRLNTDGSRDNSFMSNNDRGVEKIIVLPNGKLLTCGNGNDVVERLSADGEKEAGFSGIFRSVLNSWVKDMAVQPDGKVVAAVGIDSGTSVTTFRLNADLTVDAAFAMGTAKTHVKSFAVLPDGKILFGGDFLTFNNQPRMRIGRLNANGTIDAAFNHSFSSYGLVTAMKRQPDGKILITGTFEFVNGVRRSDVARLNPDGSLDNTFNPPPEPFDYYVKYIYDLELQPDGKILIARQPLLESNLARTDSLSPDGLIHRNLAIIRLNPDGSYDETFTAHYELFRAQTLGVQPNNKILFSGFGFNGSDMYGMRRLNDNGSFDITFNTSQQPSIGSIREILMLDGGNFLVGGTFSNTGGFTRVGSARFNADGTLDASYSAAVPGVHALALAGDGKIYLGGTFEPGTDNPNRNFTRVNANGSRDVTFNVGSGANGFVRDVAVQPNGKIVIGGDFSSYNGATANRVARVNTDGSLDSTFNPDSSGSVYAVETQPDGKVLVAGQFLDFNGIEKFSLVRLQDSAINSTPFDFDGDRKTDISIFRPTLGEWWYQRSSDGGNYAAQFGASTDKLTPADFTGDGKTDIAFFRPSTGEWFVLRSENQSYYSFPFGANGDIPSVGDFDLDGKADATVFRPSTGTWYINMSTGGAIINHFGQSGDVPVVADYDGDAKADFAIYRVALGEWWIQRSTAGLIAFQFGNSSDKPVQGDYTGDGKADVALFRPNTGEWFVLRSENLSFYSFPFGTNGDIPSAGDYDGDGKFDATVFRPSNNTWYSQRTTAGTLIQSFGQTGDVPVPSAFVP